LTIHLAFFTLYRYPAIPVGVKQQYLSEGMSLKASRSDRSPALKQMWGLNKKIGKLTDFVLA